MQQPAPVFISYSRKDYYFAESLASHLQRYKVPVWLDAKDLEPGAGWQQQIEAAIDAAPALILIVSPDSVKRPQVRMEWERALQAGKRIVLVRFRGARLPDELAQFESVDFRALFQRPLRTLIQLLAGAQKDSHLAVSLLPIPWWILTISLALLIQLAAYLSLADWSSSSDESMGWKIALWILGAFAAFIFFWLFCLSFLRRRMGMTHLVICFAFPTIWSVYPLLRYWIAGPDNIPEVWRAALTNHLAVVELSSALTVAGFAILLLGRPEALLRWTPTGKAWPWYRESCLLKTPGADRPSPLRQVKLYSLIHDAVDGPAASRLRAELTSLGASETPAPNPDHTTILLLTSRTHVPWLTDQTSRLNSKVLTVVGSRIGLPQQLDWLWKREWIDFRHWSVERLDRKKGLLQIPEAVSNVRYPLPVRIVHQLLCALAALAFSLLPLGDPEFNHRPAGQDAPPSEQFLAVLVFSLVMGIGILAQRFLNRTISRRAFSLGWKTLLAATCLFDIWAQTQAFTRQSQPWRSIPISIFLIAFPFLLIPRLPAVDFWFPSPGMGKVGDVPRLRAGRQWQTLIWVAVYLFVWGYFVGMYDN